MKTTTVICDHCKRDITYRPRQSGFRLALSVEIRPQEPDSGGVYTLCYITPPLDSDKDFCGVLCLKEWSATA